jgi:hypothetical protein
MSEKKGFTGKMKYDFDTSKCCEIEWKPGRWGRVTSREFRSFNGNRRILNVSDPSNSFYECYEGPIYFYGTNNKVPENELCEGYNYSGGVDPREQYRVTGRKGRI